MSRRSETDERRGSPGREERSDMAPSDGPKLVIKVEALPKFDPAKEGSFKNYNAKLRTAARANGLNDAVKISDRDLKTFLEKDEAAWSNADKRFAKISTTLFLYIIMNVDDSSDEGSSLLSLLHDKYERGDGEDAKDMDDGAGAYKELVKTYGGVTKVSTIGLIHGLKDIKLRGSTPNEIQSYESELSNAFRKLEQAGDPISNGQKVAYLVNGLPEEWDTFGIEVVKQDLQSGSAQTYDDVLRQFKQLAPSIQERQEKRVGAEGAYFTAASAKHQSKPAAEGSGGEVLCWRCGDRWRPSGHGPEECDAKDRKCKRCKQKGHIASACPNPRAKSEEDKEGAPSGADSGADSKSLAAILKRIESRLEKLEETVKEGSVAGGTAGLAITDQSRRSGHLSEDDIVEYGGVRF